jgi:putative FmdB family regulatory protein
VPTYGYRCTQCRAITELERRVSDRDCAPRCPFCGTSPTYRIVGYGAQIVARPWYEKDETITTWFGVDSQKERVEHQKRWERENEASWVDPEGEYSTTSRSELEPASAVDIYKNLTPDTVQRELKTMYADGGQEG